MTQRTPHELLEHLRELIDALDRRCPHPERDGEGRIAGDAADLRASAMRLIEALEPAPPSPQD